MNQFTECNMKCSHAWNICGFREGGWVSHFQLWMAITSLIMVRFVWLKNWRAAEDFVYAEICKDYVPEMAKFLCGEYIMLYSKLWKINSGLESSKIPSSIKCIFIWVESIKRFPTHATEILTSRNIYSVGDHLAECHCMALVQVPFPQ